MFDRNLFARAVERSGLRKRYIAEQLGMGYDTFLKKSYGSLEWKCSEAMACSQILKMKRAERDAIFFAPEVDKE